MKKLRVHLFLAIAVVILSGCSGLRYTEFSPEAKNFHPKTIGILPVDVGKNEEARGVIDKIVVDALHRKKWFDKVVSPDDVKQRMTADEGLHKGIDQYQSKLNLLNFSDPQLSQKIGETFGVEAILMVRVDYWLYTKDKGDDIAKAGLDMKLVDTGNGRLIWRAGHHIDKSYTLFKPAIPDVAQDVARKMISDLPH